MKSYYHQHETAYQRAKAKGHLGWGDAKSLNDLGDPQTKEYLRAKISKHFPTTSGKSALDLGCGSGTTAFILAHAGFTTTGIDISETAIEMGRDLASQQNLKINFIAGDVLNLASLNQKFDFIYDSHFLHCIVIGEDRNRVLTQIKRVLQPGGVFILDTMVVPESGFEPEKLFAGLRFDKEYILWHKTAASDDRGVVEINREYWCMQRRIYPFQTILDEVKAAGFELLEQQLDPQENHPSMLRLVLK